ncbi:hypothetical protein N7468_004395 [Penicillium chermesinum]|uniref:Zinc finger Mcm10/DnaG-type domain-containing protein n=1 Tax=Penicillium chermesinum TaxID=63820 RepID=A0A9W9P883_9EURO|nr:uncharacterized protein N7468_004395 [Penicillium chermesinum]KAJ5239776.1 hypothetical protein N7468_004395 [Penicillium chermesinum]
MLSSPGGRRKYQDMQRRRELLSSPMKRSSTTPNLHSKANQILDDELEDGEDEETLQLKLAEIQARLKLKQLQKNRGRSGTLTSNPDDEDEMPASTSKVPSRASALRSPPPSHQRAPSDGVQVPMSPTKKLTPAPEPWSPRRRQLGIDKGWKASDVSLKRPRSSRPDPRPASHLGTRPGATSRSSDLFSPRPQTSPAGGGGLTRIKSFSERMAEGRAAEKAEKARLERAERVQASRSSGFQLDQAEIESYKAMAAKEPDSALPSANREPQVQQFNREEILRSLDVAPRPGGLKRSQTTSNIREGNGKRQLTNSGARKDLPSDTPDRESSSTPDPSKFESYSSLHLSSRILPHSFLSRSMADKKILRIPDLLKTIKTPDFELPDEIDGDYVVFGIVASKSDPKETKQKENSTAKEANPYDDGLNNTNKYMVITLTDLKWTIDLFLFDTAFPRYYKITEGTLVAILNPTIMPPPKHKLDTNRFSLVLSSSDDKVLEIGKAQDIGFCKAMRKDGKTCQSWVDGRKTEFCDFHIDLQVRRTQGQRSGVNSQNTNYGPGGRSGSRTGFFSHAHSGSNGSGWRNSHDMSKRAIEGLLDEGPKYDLSSQSTYYVAPAPKNRGAGRTSYNPVTGGGSAASLIDAIDDPFIAAAGMGPRGRGSKEDMMRRRLAEQKRERDIRQRLVAGRIGGPGADYLRQGVGSPSTENKDQKPSASGAEVKKTRFITAKGIREAGRESLGGPDTSQQPILSDDDDLEFI